MSLYISRIPHQDLTWVKRVILPSTATLDHFVAAGLLLHPCEMTDDMRYRLDCIQMYSRGCRCCLSPNLINVIGAHNPVTDRMNMAMEWFRTGGLLRNGKDRLALVDEALGGAPFRIRPDDKTS